MKLRITVDGLQDARALISGFSERRMRAVVATAATRTVRAVEQAWQGQLQGRFDRPTPSTLRATAVSQATAANPQASVFIKDQPGAGGRAPQWWLAPEERGGQRGLKKFEAALIAQGSMQAGWRAVPGPAAQLDGYGNVTRGTIVQVIAQLGAQYSPGYQRVISPSAQRRVAKALKTGRKYLAIKAQNGALRPGVYLREGRQLRPVFYFVRTVGYRPRLDLMAKAAAVAAAKFPSEFDRALSDAVAAVKAKRGGP